MFGQDTNSIAGFPDTGNFLSTILEIRSLVTELEFKREEMNQTLDSLHKAFAEVSKEITQSVK